MTATLRTLLLPSAPVLRAAAAWHEVLRLRPPRAAGSEAAAIKDRRADVTPHRVRRTLVRAIADGRLPELVLDKGAKLSQAISDCLEVLGIGTSTAEEQAAAARALVALATHEQLRPAVDNLMVLRRLCRIIELTSSPTALAAAVGAVYAVADDAAWESEGGGAAEVLGDTLVRCVATMTAATKALGGQAFFEHASRAHTIALAAAAATALRPQALHLLSPTQLTKAAEALGTCLACGYEGPEVLAALAGVLQRCKDAAAPQYVAAAAAVADAGAAAALVRAVAASTRTQRLPTQEAALGKKKQSRQLRKRKSPLALGEGTPDFDLGGKRGRAGGGSSRDRVSAPLSASARDACACLAHVLVACGGPGSSGEQAAAWKAARAGFGGLGDAGAAALVPLLHLGPEEAGRALHALLALLRCDSAEGVEGGGALCAVTAGGAGQENAAAFLRASNRLLACKPAGLVADDTTLLLRLCADLLAAGALTPRQLWKQAPGLAEAAVGVLTGEPPGAAWSAFEAAAVPSVGGRASYPANALPPAAVLVCALLEWAAGADSADERAALAAWLPVSSIAWVLAARLAEERAAGATAVVEGLGVPGVRCLALALQLAPPEDIWASHGLGFLERLAGAVRTDVLPDKALHATTAGRAAAAQLAAALLLSGWAACGGRRAPSTHRGSPQCTARKALVELATDLLTQQQAAQDVAPAPQAAAEQLAALAGALNAVVACLDPQHALAGSAAQPLSPGLPEALLAAVAGKGESCGPLVSYIRNKYSHGGVQLKWFFELPSYPDNADRYFLTDPPLSRTAGSATALPLLRAMVAAATRITQLVGEAAQGGAVVRAAVRVVGSVGVLLCDCIHPPEDESWEIREQPARRAA
ncbi:hypothetical protein TSOC_003724 [Tetrabaena socialis]|uniref:Uncharacterized protein n=1 Tax=Tetrabaena socialis TaxID=47790 RepID=A0A2J8AAV0_9CHLO|nr:hypothetical protein TSOC_003724 [Tetrabaena socialis]|eukprot:PNH09645.1 hypothetical protein TSOC_003724 [Tetrabaena socialis]